MTGKEDDPAAANAENNATICAPDPHLLELLVCPLTKSSLDYCADRSELISRSARLAFPIIDGIPLLALEAARPLTDADLP